MTFDIKKCMDAEYDKLFIAATDGHKKKQIEKEMHGLAQCEGVTVTTVKDLFGHVF